jgi:hypothetical protein
MALPPPSSLRKGDAGRRKKAESVLDRPLALCGGSGAAIVNPNLAKPLTASTYQPENLGKGSQPRRIHVSPEGPLKQRTHLQLARGPAQAGFAEKQPWPDRHANRPYRRSI